jgi:stage II sporulation protein D
MKLYLRYILVASIFLFFANLLFAELNLYSQVFSDEVKTIEEKIKESEKLKKEKEDVLKKIQSDISAISNSNMSIASKIAALDKELTAVQAEYDKRKKEVEDSQKLLEDKALDYDKKENSLKAMIVESYKSSNITLLEMLLNKNSKEDLVRVYELHKKVAEKQEETLIDLELELVDIREQKKSLEQEMDLVNAQKQGLDEAMAALRSEQAMIMARLAAQQGAQNTVAGDIASINKQLSSLSKELKAAIDAKVGSGGNSTGGGNYAGGTSPQPVTGSAGVYEIRVNGEVINANAAGPIRVTVSDASAVHRVNGSLLYRGVMEMRADSNMFLINELSLDHYLYGLAEVPSSWGIEALKAQVIAGRSYAVKNWNKRVSFKYNIRDDVYDQNYTGFSKEAEVSGNRWVEAVNATSGKVLKSGGDIVATYYHASCGGHTLASEEVWVSALPYVRAESDRTTARDSYGDLIGFDNSSLAKKKWCGSSSQACTGADTISDAQLLDLGNAAIYLQQNPSKQNDILPPASGGKSAAEIELLLGAQSLQARIGTFTGASAVYNDGSTTIEASSRKTDSLRVSGSAGSVNISASHFWTVFNSRSPGSQHIYYSNLWSVYKVSGSWNFYTRGYGHRVGMCQWGANGRANAGQSSAQILSAYYRGTSVDSYATTSPIRIGITRVGSGDVTITSYNSKGYAVYANGVLLRILSGSDTLRVIKK